MTRVDVVEDVVGDEVDTVHEFVIEDRVWVFAVKLRDAVDHIRLMLEDIRDEDILAEVIWKANAPVNLHLEEDLFVEELGGVVDKEVILRLSVSVEITRPVTALELSTLARLHVGGGRENLELLVGLQCVPQVLKL